MDRAVNPNNCSTCDHKKNPQGGHCYMFRDAPIAVCMCHTGRKGMTVMEAIDEFYSMRRRGEAHQYRSTPEPR